MVFPKQIQNLIEAFERLPGIGPKTAERLAFYLLHVPETEINRFSEAVAGLKDGIVLCKICKNVSGEEICEICSDEKRDHDIICVVENALDVFSLEKSGKYRGVYHVLHGVINPLDNIGPEELYIQDLINRIRNGDEESKKLRAGNEETKEVILALNPTMEGEATAMYIAKNIKSLNTNYKITRLGVGMPMGGDMQYADETTLQRAMEGRRDY